MGRGADLEQLYEGLAVFARRSRELSAGLHPGLSLGAFTMLSYIDNRPDVRAADIAAEWGLAKSTVSREIGRLIDDQLLVSVGERPGRRGHQLEVTDSGRTALDSAARSIHTLLLDQLHDWTDSDIATFAGLINRFNGGTESVLPS